MKHNKIKRSHWRHGWFHGPPSRWQTRNVLVDLIKTKKARRWNEHLATTATSRPVSDKHQRALPLVAHWNAGRIFWIGEAKP